MLWQPKRILGWTFITVLAINCHSEVRRKPKKIYSTTNQTAKTKDELWTINSMALFNEFQDPFPPLMILQRKLSCQKHMIQLGVCSASCHLWRNGWAELLVVVVVVEALSLLLQPCGSGALFNLPWNQTKPNQQKDSNSKRFQSQSNAIVKF